VLASNAETAVANLSISALVEKIEDIKSIMNFGVMSTPALVVDGKVVFSGRVATVNEIQALLSKEQ
jgi:predicted thioredoxin/glutaredoxin